MLRFAHSEYLYFLYGLPILVVLFWFTYKNKNKVLNKFANKEIQNVLFPLRSKFKVFYKFGIIVLAMALLIVGIANPQIGSKIEEVKQVGIDVLICLDVSLSMKAEDIKPSRLEKAKYEIGKLIKNLRGDRLGLIVFSGNAYVQFPLTTDYAAANLFLSAVDVSSVPQPGTNIGEAINLALNSFKKDDDTKKAIVVITDGEHHEGKLEEMVTKASEKGVQIYAIGLGSAKGEPIPIYNKSGRRIGYKKDKRGNTVLTKLDETTLRELTKKGGGKYYKGTNTNDELEEIYNDLAKIEKSEFGATKITDYEDRFYYFLAPAILLLFFEFFVSFNKSKFFAKFESK